MPDARTDDDADQPLCARARRLVDAPPGTVPDAGAAPVGPAERARHHEEVVALLRRALASGEPDAASLLALAHLGRGERHAAVEVLIPAVHHHGRVDLAGVLGETLAQLGDHEGAETAFLLGLDAGDAGATNDYGMFLRDRGRTQEAAYVLGRATAAGDELAPLNLVALHLEELDDVGAATAIAEEHADESRPSSLVALADVRLAGGRLDDAEVLYRRAVELGGGSAHLSYAWFLLERRGDVAGTEEHLARAREAGEQGATFQLARFLHDAGRRDEAYGLLEEAADAGDVDASELLDQEYTSTVDRWDD